MTGICIVSSNLGDKEQSRFPYLDPEYANLNTNTMTWGTFIPGRTSPLSFLSNVLTWKLALGPKPLTLAKWSSVDVKIPLNCPGYRSRHSGERGIDSVRAALMSGYVKRWTKTHTYRILSKYNPKSSAVIILFAHSHLLMSHGSIPRFSTHWCVYENPLE